MQKKESVHQGETTHNPMIAFKKVITPKDQAIEDFGNAIKHGFFSEAMGALNRIAKNLNQEKRRRERVYG